MESRQLHDASSIAKPATSNVTSPTDQDNSPSIEPTVDPDLSYNSKPNEILKNVEHVSYIYRQDVVRSKTNGKIGIVTEVAGDTDSDGSETDDEDDDDDDDDVDDDEKDEEAGSKDEHDENTEGSPHQNADGKTDDNDESERPLTADHVRILWMDDSESTECTDDIIVVDRGFLHGDYVAAASDPTGQIGIVVDVNISVDLLAHDRTVLRDIPSNQLKRVREFTVGDHVILGPWLGRIEDVFDNVTVLLDDGSVCKVMKADPLRLKPVGKNILEDGHFPYYPGQRVKASSSSVFKNSRWLSGLWKANRLEGTVTKVTVGSVFIYWIASAGYGPDSATTPAEEQSPKDLKLLSCFTHTNWQLGDWCLLQLPPRVLPDALEKEPQKSESQDSAKDELESTETGDESDAEVTNTEQPTGSSKSMECDLETFLASNSETNKGNVPVGSDISSLLPDQKRPVQEARPLHRKKMRKVVVKKEKKVRKKVEAFERALLIINTKTKVDVKWQDGRVEQGLDSTSLIPIDSPGDHEFVAEQYVVEKAADESMENADVRRVGVIKSVNARDRTACVRWLKAVARVEDPREFDKEELVSVYELEGHPDYDYCHGDVVVRLSPISLPAQMDSSAQAIEDQQLHSPEEPKRENEEPKHENGSDNFENSSVNNPSLEFSDLSWVGNITGLKDGDIEVTWADGMISTVGPQAIYVVGRNDDDSVAGGSYGSDDAASWETVEDDNAETVDIGSEDHGADNSGGSDIEDSNMDVENSGRNGALSIPIAAALGLMSRIANGILSMGRKQSDSANSDSKSEEDPDSDELHMNGDPSEKSGIEDQISKLSTNCNGTEHNMTKATKSTEAMCKSSQPELDSGTSDKTVTTFTGFDIVRDPSDHYFLGSQGSNNNSRKWLKKVQRDWDILQNNLPDGIYVRAYEDRMDLLRAVIVGAYGTPYQDGLFFFDFHLPPEYPDVPPSAYYHSGGWRINPNLYEEGKVCLSLLNTWTGKGNEVWDPSTSSILQVLVSLQGLVLNSRPYFNEAGYDKQVGTAEGEKNSLSYNENTFLLNCKTIMYLIRKPPKDFEELVVEHFRKRGCYILKACDAYMKGHMIGSLAKDASTISVSDEENLNSVGFKLMLAKIVPRLVAALSGVGADCHEFSHLMQSQRN